MTRLFCTSNSIAPGRPQRQATVGMVVMALVVAVVLPEEAAAQTRPVTEYPMRIQVNVPVPVGGGVHLSADVYRPPENGRYPTVFQLTPYNNNGPGVVEQAWHFVHRGYAFVPVDLRGRYDAEGVFDPWRNDMQDGFTVMDWIAAQPWSNGKVATMGGSYLGMDQWLMAKAHNPHHAAIVSYVAPADGFLDAVRFSGVPKVDLIYTWSMGMYGRVNQSMEGFDWPAVMQELPLSQLDAVAGRPTEFWRRWMEEDRLGPYWEPMMMQGHYRDFDIPSFNVTGWWDGQVIGATKNFQGAVATSAHPTDHVLIIGPWLHGVNRNRRIGERDYGPQAIIDLDGLRDRWLDHLMLGTEAPDQPPVMYFLQTRNEWRHADGWPLPNTRFTSYYLDSQGGANTLLGNGVLREEIPGNGPPDSFTYDPMNPVRTVSSRTSGARGGIAQGSVDNRGVETRGDVLVYTSDPLGEGVEVTGPVTAAVFISTDVPDTDVTVKLLDVDPSGRALNLSHGVARARYRSSYSEPELLEEGRVYEIPVQMFPTSNFFAAGHRIRIEVSSSNFPLFGRNLNIARSSDTSTDYQVAHTRVHHRGEHRSHIVLPVVPGTASNHGGGGVSR